MKQPKRIYNLPHAENQILPFDVNYVKNWLDRFEKDIKVNPIQSLFEDLE
jgi:hypothetical protein